VVAGAERTHVKPGRSDRLDLKFSRLLWDRAFPQSATHPLYLRETLCGDIEIALHPIPELAFEGPIPPEVEWRGWGMPGPRLSFEQRVKSRGIFQLLQIEIGELGHREVGSLYDIPVSVLESTVGVGARLVGGTEDGVVSPMLFQKRRESSL
jgi:hypothetical protein